MQAVVAPSEFFVTEGTCTHCLVFTAMKWLHLNTGIVSRACNGKSGFKVLQPAATLPLSCCPSLCHWTQCEHRQPTAPKDAHAARPLSRCTRRKCTRANPVTYGVSHSPPDDFGLCKHPPRSSAVHTETYNAIKRYAPTTTYAEIMHADSSLGCGSHATGRPFESVQNATWVKQGYSSVTHQ